MIFQRSDMLKMVSTILPSSCVVLVMSCSCWCWCWCWWWCSCFPWAWGNFLIAAAAAAGPFQSSDWCCLWWWWCRCDWWGCPLKDPCYIHVHHKTIELKSRNCKTHKQDYPRTNLETNFNSRHGVRRIWPIFLDRNFRYYHRSRLLLYSCSPWV